jgi:NAD(P)-dependent dehydrogenase (short-subunit alcohol dehydrogenase family)
MRQELKPIGEQVIVITGASSGIGLVTARKAARRGACVMLVARNATDLAHSVDEIRQAGGRAAFHVADVSNPGEVRDVAEATVREFGRIDTWINNAAVALYGRITELAVEDMRRQFDVNYWGAVYGCLSAVPHLRSAGGAIINVASALADRAIPLQGNYCAAKHALKAFTDSLRMELEEEGLPISVTLVKPGSVDTPFFEKAKTVLGVEPRAIPPIYDPAVVGRAILMCVERPVRDVIVGGRGKFISLTNAAPRLTDRYMERHTFNDQLTDIPVTAAREDNLYVPVAHDGGEHGRFVSGPVLKRSLYTSATLHPRRTALIAAALGAVLTAGLTRQRRNGRGGNGRR